MLILLFLYFGIIALGNAISNRDSAAKACAVLAIVGVVNIPIIKYSVEWWNTLHQGATFTLTEKPAMPAEMWLPLLLTALGFYCFFGAVLLLRMRLEVLKREARASWVKAEVLNSLGGGRTMSFASFGDFLAMGHHGLYVWSAYGICLAVLALNVGAPCWPAALPARRGASSAPGEQPVNPLRKKRLLIIVGLLAGVGIAVGPALSALQQNINLFYTPTQIANGEAPLDTRIRAGGMVEKARCNVRPTRWTCASWSPTSTSRDHHLPRHPPGPVPRRAGHRRPGQAQRRRRGGGR
jgi:heme exporter protein CcmD